MRLAIDLDDVIHDTHNVLPGYKMGQPIQGAVRALQQLHSEGNQIIIHTVWADSPQKIKAISDWLDYFNIPHANITNRKPLADFYIDDKALRFINWDKTLTDIEELHED